MAERQQDLGKRLPEQLQSGEFLFRLSLPDIYGKYIYPTGTKFAIDFDMYKSLTYGSKEEVVVAKQTVMERFNMPSIASWGGGGPDGFSVSPGPTEPLGFWVPQQAERRLLAALAVGLSTRKDNPVVVEVEAGTGIVSKSLAAESSVKVIALEKDGAKLVSLPPAKGDVVLRQGDAWDVLQELGPKYPDELTPEVFGYLDVLRTYHQAVEVVSPDMSNEQRAVMSRMRYLSKVAIKRMQQLGPQHTDESTIDMVIQSVGEKSSNGLTTVAIRDGLQPKAIVYIRQVPGLQPIPEDWQEQYSQSHIRKNWIANFDPGENYRTVAAWRTFSEKYWGYHMYNLCDAVPQMQTEVLVQLRKDVRIADLAINTSPEYPFDGEVLEVLGRYGKGDEFRAGINAAREQLLAA